MKNTGKNGPNRAQAVGFAGPCLAPAVFLALVATAAADIHYVNAVGGSPAAPYTNWATAATNIQAAVDEAVNGDVVLVANGLYTPSTDVFVSTGIVVRSANGALNTVVDGSDLVRGFYVVGPGAMAAGFTVINGNANSGEGGGVYCDDNATVKNCIIRGSVAHHGGGIYVGAGAMVTNCILSGNDATQGILPHGGAIHCAGGSAFGCRVYDNYAGFYGGGIYCTGGGVVRNCEAWDNVSSSAGGGMAIQDSGLIENCTVVDNESNWGGGIYVITGGDVRNSIAYFNTGIGGGDNLWNDLGGMVVTYSCTTPNPGGDGNITNAPVFLGAQQDNWHLVAGSPGVDAGTNCSWMAGNVDAEGSPRVANGAVDMGAYEFGSLQCDFRANKTAGAAPLEVLFTALVAGTNLVDLYYEWDFDNNGTPELSGEDLAVVTNVFTEVGFHSVSLSVSNSAGEITYSLKLDCIEVAWATVYVSQSGASLSPYTNWATAATNFQNAIDVGSYGTLVLASNGTYEVASQINVSNMVTVASVNGPDFTVVDGRSSTDRCFFLSHPGAALNGFTIIGNPADTTLDGRGVYLGHGGIVANCVITGGRADKGGGVFLDEGGLVTHTILTNNVANSGGGAYCWKGGMVRNCLVATNAAFVQGGGIHCYQGGVVRSCTIVRNTCADTGGGVFANNGGTFRNTILAENRAFIGDNWATNTSLSRFDYCCISDVSPGGISNIVADPLFRDSAGGDFRLQVASPCVDAGINMGWSYRAVDLDENPRIMNGTVDIGAYELTFLLSARIFMEGPYDTNTHVMSTTLRAMGAIPLTSPYEADHRTVGSIPTNAVDWVLVEARELQAQQGTNNAALSARSVFINSDGYLIDEDGNTTIAIDVAPGNSRYIAVKHRNHLAAMSVTQVVFNALGASYDFTTGSNRFCDARTGAKALEPGVWGMMAGNADGDRKITIVDRYIHGTQLARSGYYRSDFDLDGVVAGADRIPQDANEGSGMQVSWGETVLSPSLTITPWRKTVLEGETIQFSVAGGTSRVYWAIVGGTSSGTVHRASGLYQAPSQAGPFRVDVVEAWDADNLLARAFVNVVSSNDIAQAGKAIIIAGRRSPDDPLWPTTDYLADSGYNTLLYRGFSKANVQYVSPETEQDADGNGEFDDVDLEATHANAALTFTNWAANSDRLFVYLVDHGGDSAGAGYFRLNPTQTLTAAELVGWLDDLQTSYDTEITLVIDCCHAGSFVDELGAGSSNRIVIAACEENEPTYFVAGGLVSFSDAFFSGMLLGLNVEDSFLQAQEAMSPYQSAIMDDDGNGLYQEGVDGAYAATIEIGATYVAGKDIPQIGLVSGNQLLSGESTATMWADGITSCYPIERVWCMIVPPGHDPDPDDPVADIAELDLLHDDDSGRYEATYGGFSQDGSYKVVFYARDAWGSVSVPMQSYVSQTGFEELVVLVSAGTTNDADWETQSAMANLAYHTFVQRWFDDDSIYYLSANTNQDLNADGTNDVDGLPTVANLWALTNWARDRFTIYLVGNDTNDAFRMNASETLSAIELDNLVDALQEGGASACVVLEFDGSGAFIPDLLPPYDTERITIASTGSGTPACKAVNGLVSFSTSFLGSIFTGKSIGDAFHDARTFIRLGTGLKQRAEMDDNGDGVFNSKVDGNLAEDRYIGSAFMTGADIPLIDAVTPDTVLVETNSLLLWASGVTDVDGISNVWCVITPPDYDGFGELSETNLAWNAGNERYELLYSTFDVYGTYACMFFAEDNTGELAEPVVALISRGDVYEHDDTPLEAGLFAVGSSERHLIHYSDDIDWVKFYALTNYTYEIKTDHVGANIDTVMGVYRQMPDGTLTNVFGEEIDFEGKDWGEIVLLDDFVAGTYCVSVRAYDEEENGPDSEYDLTIHVPGAPDGVLVVAVVDKLNPSASPPTSIAIVDGVDTNELLGATTTDFVGLTPGVYTVRVTAAAGYLPEEDPRLPDQPANMDSFLYGNPKRVTVSASQWQVLIFQFVPYARMDGLVRNGKTGERVSDAAVEFEAIDGIIAGLVYDGYPNNAAYESLWDTLADGTLPTNVWLPTVDWHMTITKQGYSNTVITNCITGLSPGDIIDLGTTFVVQVDGDTNGLPDCWEDDHFPWETPGPGDDDDDDGLQNIDEYLCGTDPHDSGSVLAFDLAEPGSSFTMEWPVSEGRTYRVRANTNLLFDVWPVVYGPTEATNGQTRMSWTDTSTVDDIARFYRLELVVP